MSRGTLHASKPDGARRRRNAPAHGETKLVRDGLVRGVPHAEATGDDTWLPQTVAWWETWRRVPQSQLFEETDWSRLAMLAAIVDGYWKRPSAAAMGEIRMSEERLGATVVDRMRARMRIEAPATDQPETSSDGVVVDATAAIAARLNGGA
jgi:hypothetical protein